MKKLFIIAALPLLFSAQFITAKLQQLEESSWPELITFDNLTIKKDHYKQSYDSSKPSFLEQKIKVETKMYQMEGPTGHGHYTTIYYLVQEDVFWLHSDCEMGHADGFIGPFVGNPKVLLAKN